VTAGSGGKVTPRSSTARPGTNRTFTIKPLKGHHVAEVRLDGATIFEDRKTPDVPNDGAARDAPSRRAPSTSRPVSPSGSSRSG
jgi:hypothetical protein